MTCVSRFAAVLLAGLLFAAPAAMSAQGPRPPGAYYQGGDGRWDAPPRGYSRDLQRNGFRDGLDGARKDLENRRRPNVNNRDEYRNYRGPGQRVYRQAFQAGYGAFWQHQGYRGH